MSKELIQNTDYSANLALLAAQFAESPNLKGILSRANLSANDIEAALFEIRDNIWIDTAIGEQLDFIGAIIGVAREGLSDSDYRIQIKLRIGFIFSGEPEAIIRVALELYGGTFVQYISAAPAVPAMYYLLTDSIITNTQLEAITPAGVLGAKGTGIVSVDGLDDYLVDALGRRIFCVASAVTDVFDFAIEDGSILAIESGDTLILLE